MEDKGPADFSRILEHIRATQHCSDESPLSSTALRRLTLEVRLTQSYTNEVGIVCQFID